MNVVTFELRAANKDCTDKLTDIANTLYKGQLLFDYACSYTNSSSSYKKAGRVLEIVEVADEYLRVRLTSEGKLEMPSKSLAGFSRELLRVDAELHPGEDDRMFKNFVRASSLFRNIELAETDIQIESSEMSDVEALKRCVDIFCNTMGSGKDANKLLDETKKSIKKLLKGYDSSSRMISYYKRTKEIRG